MSEIIKSFKGRAIRIRKTDRYVCLTDLASAVQIDVERFVESDRLNRLVVSIYQKQQKAIVHPIQYINGDIWIHRALTLELSYQLVFSSISQDVDAIKFAIFLDDVTFPELQHPEVFEAVIEKSFTTIQQKSEVNIAMKKMSSKFKGWVYFILNETRQEVKIGHSVNPDCRIKSFQTGNTDKWREIGRIEGDKTTEKTIHRELVRHRISNNRELFQYNKNIELAICQHLN